MPDTCSSFTALEDNYNISLHIGAIFIILSVSGGACVFPIIAVKIPQLCVPTRFLFFVRHFGTGVLLATAFVHLLPTAFTSLTDPCLPAFWNEKYPAMAGAIAIAAVFVIVIMEMVFSHGHMMCNPPDSIGDANVATVPFQNLECICEGTTEKATSCGREKCIRLADEHHFPSNITTPPNHDCSDGHDQISMQKPDSDLERKEVASPPHPSQSHGEEKRQRSASVSSVSPSLTPAQRRKRETLQCVLLELGILFHSIFIGMALSVAIGDDFIVLLIAISFHQTFEGLALGSRIAALSLPNKSPQPYLMALAYGCTTPIGQAIGLAVSRSAYDPSSSTGLIMVGIMNAISAGLLTYASLVELMAEDFLSERSWRTLRGRRRVGACVLVFAGAACMSIVGAWA